MIDPGATPKFVFDERDLKIEWYSGTGAGGQHRNKHQNSCRLTHIPSGEMATAQCRSRENSLLEAKAALLDRLTRGARAGAHQAMAHVRKDQVGSGERGDKIRTYRFQDNQVKDHQTGKQAPCDRVLAGNFQLLW